MNIQNYVNYGCAVYPQHLSVNDAFKLGDVVINKDKQIGVIIQVHSENEFRCDMFGNFSSSEVKLATIKQIAKYRPKIEKQGTFIHS